MPNPIINRKTLFNPLVMTSFVPLGTLIDYQTFPDLTTWTQSGSVIAASGGKLLLTATTSVFTNYILDNSYGYSCLEYFEQTCEFVVTEKSATSNGIGIGMKDTTNANVYNICRFSTNSGVSGGKMDFFLQSLGTSQATSSAIAFALNDVMKMTFGRRTLAGVDQYYAQIENITAPVTPVTLTFNIGYSSPLPSGVNGSGTWRYGIFAFRGTSTVNNYKVTSTALKAQKTGFFGDSITRGLYSDTQAQRFANVINPSTFIVAGGPGDTSDDLVKRINEIKAFAPTYAVLSIGTNDVANGVANATTMANIATIVAGLESVGTTVFVCKQMPRTAVVLTTLNNSIGSTYPTSFIDLFTPMESAGAPNPALFNADLVHPNVAGHAVVASTISTAFPQIQ